MGEESLREDGGELIDDEGGGVEVVIEGDGAGQADGGDDEGDLSCYADMVGGEELAAGLVLGEVDGLR